MLPRDARCVPALKKTVISREIFTTWPVGPPPLLAGMMLQLETYTGAVMVVGEP
jgi:hypothetical protein